MLMRSKYLLQAAVDDSLRGASQAEERKVGGHV